MPSLNLAGRPIAITGASSGIGAATAIACARAGMPVVLMARRLDKLEGVAERVRDAGGKAAVVAGDVTDPDHGRVLLERAASAFGDEFGPVYAVFANAGYGFEGAVAETDEVKARRLFEVNFWGTLRTLAPVIEQMRARARTAPSSSRSPRGHLLICSSCVSKIGVPHLSAYTASKAAQDHFGRALRHELRPDRIRVSTVHPVGTKTEFFDTAADHTEQGGGALRTPQMLMQPAERVADAVVRCLQRPKGEVWTSRSTRLLLGLATAWPWLADAAIGRVAGGAGKARGG